MSNDHLTLVEALEGARIGASNAEAHVTLPPDTAGRTTLDLVYATRQLADATEILAQAWLTQEAHTT